MAAPRPPPWQWANDVSILCMAGAIALIIFRVAQPYAFTGPNFWDMAINDRWWDDIQRERDFQRGNADYPPFVQFAGLLPLAHQRGLQELRADWTYNDATLSLAHAGVLFPFGHFAESGDATPENWTKKVTGHFGRVALTRAKARGLRDALGVDLVAVEELGEGK